MSSFCYRARNCEISQFRMQLSDTCLTPSSQQGEYVSPPGLNIKLDKVSQVERVTWPRPQCFDIFGGSCLVESRSREPCF